MYIYIYIYILYIIYTCIYTMWTVFYCPQMKQLKQPFFSIDNKNVLAVNVKAKATHTATFH